MWWKHFCGGTDTNCRFFWTPLRGEPICNYLCSRASEMFLFLVNQLDGWRQLVRTKWFELCFEKLAGCLYRESWKKRERIQWNDCRGFLATWVRCCLSLSHPLLPPTILPMVACLEPPSVTTVTVHKRVGGAKRFGNGKCGQASHSASISSLSSSLFGTFATLRLTWLFFFELWLSWCYLLTYIYFLACQSVRPFTECLPEAILTEIWICCTSKIVGNPFVIIFLLILFDNAPLFSFSLLAVWNDSTGWLIDLDGLF